MRQDKTGPDQIKPDETAPDRPRTAKAGANGTRPGQTGKNQATNWFSPAQTRPDRLNPVWNGFDCSCGICKVILGSPQRAMVKKEIS